MEPQKPTSSPLWHTAAMIACFWALTTCLTLGAPAGDGQTLYGFPLIFYSWGGRCSNGLCENFRPLWLGIDIAILIGVPLLVWWLERRFARRMHLALKLLLVVVVGVLTSLLVTGWMGFVAQYVLYHLGLWRPY